MNYFSLIAHGDDFDVDGYLSTTPFTIEDVWYRGDLRGCPESGQDKHPTSGFSIKLGEGRELTIFEQYKIATDFLESNEDDLKTLAQFTGVDTFILGLHYHIKLTPEIIGFCMDAPFRLLHFALITGVKPTFYVDLIRNDIEDNA